MQELIDELKAKIVDVLMLEDIEDDGVRKAVEFVANAARTLHLALIEAQKNSQVLDEDINYH